MMYKKDFSGIYDSLYSSKDYKKECDYILSLIGENKKILDVGCGTGNHAAILSKRSDFIHGIDISSDMIKIAKKKYCFVKNLKFEKTSVEAYLSKTDIRYDAVICMFNVVNHISNLEDLMIFINSCARLLKPNGYIIFDCWNSIACAIEKPWKNSIDHKIINGEICKVSSFTEVNLMASVASIKIFADAEKSISLKLNNLTLWSPRIYTELLALNNVLLETVLNVRDLSKKAKETDHRILFVGRSKR